MKRSGVTFRNQFFPSTVGSGYQTRVLGLHGKHLASSLALAICMYTYVCMYINMYTCVWVCMCRYTHPQSHLCQANSFAPSFVYSWHFCPAHKAFRPVGGWTRQDSLSAGTLSSPFSCFDTWQQQFYFFPASSFFSHLLQGPPIKSKRHTFKQPLTQISRL